jgi:hypothetical protein
MTNEEKAVQVGNNTRLLVLRLRDALRALTPELRELFRECVFEEEKKRFLTQCGRLALQWRARLEPDEPESYDNQQTSTGTVVLVVLDKR